MTTPATLIPEGYRLAPNEPTPQMMRAFWKAGQYPARPFIDGYRAMLAAAPPPTAEPTPSRDDVLEAAVQAVRNVGGSQSLPVWKGCAEESVTAIRALKSNPSATPSKESAT